MSLPDRDAHPLPAGGPPGTAATPAGTPARPLDSALVPVDADADAAAAGPDWPALWQRIVQLRGRALGNAADHQQLAEAVEALQQQCSAASAPWVAIYRPLLDARLVQARACATPIPMPWALAQLGQSLDGCIATASGDSYFVTGPQSLLHLHRLRALVDAVLVGAGTVAADDPQLTTRRVPGPSPVRVVLDPAARLDGQARVLRDATAPTLWLCDARHAARAKAARARWLADATPAASGAAAAGATRAACEVLPVPGLLDSAGAGPHLAPAFAALAHRGLRLLLVEGGGVTVSRCLAAGLLQRLHLVVAPVLIGAGRRGLQQPSPVRMADCLRPPVQRLALGDDLLWDLDLGTPGALR